MPKIHMFTSRKEVDNNNDSSITIDVCWIIDDKLRAGMIPEVVTSGVLNTGGWYTQLSKIYRG